MLRHVKPSRVFERAEMRFHPVFTVDEVLEIALEPEESGTSPLPVPDRSSEGSPG